LKHYTKNIPGVEVRESDLMVVIHRPAEKDAMGKMTRDTDTIKIMLLGADNPDSIRGIYLDGAIIDEYAQCDPKIWSEVVRPALADRPGWAVIIGTPKGRNHFYRLYEAIKDDPTWFTYILRAGDSGVLPQEELDSMRREMSNAQYQQEMECSFDAVAEGTYFGDLMDEIEKADPYRFGASLYIPTIPVETFWDIGVGDYCTIVFRQAVEGGWQYIDYYENNNQGLDHYLEVLKTKGYKYGRHVWPHDGRVKEWGSGLTRFEQAFRKGYRNIEIQKKFSIDDGIQAIRARLRCSLFDKEKCARLIDCLRNYCHEYDYEKEIWVDKPRHDWTSHAVDAFRYNALDDKSSSMNMENRNNLPKRANSSYNEVSY
jgi:phage terminase large subunit